MGIRNYLIEGVSGTGKTSVCHELRRRGYYALNGDRELAYQGDPKTGKPVDGFAHEHHIWNVDKVRADSARGNIEAKALVAKRFKPFQVDGRVIHEIGMPWHWGYAGIAKGDSANVLTPHVGDANTMIPEYKAFLVNVRKA